MGQAKPPEKASFLYSLRAVVWSFTGLRREYRNDAFSGWSGLAMALSYWTAGV